MFDSLFAEGGLSLERLRVLIEVNDAGGIAQAAGRDPVRQSQYSRQLRELAEFFGCEVAHRKGKLLKLTAEGTRLAELAREFLRQINDFRTECRSEKTVFNIGAGDSLIQWLVIPRLGKILAKTPRVQFGTVNLRTQEIIRQITDARLDFGLVRKNALVPGMESYPLGTLTYTGVVPHALAARKPPTFLSFFTDYPLAMQTTEGEFTTRLQQMAVAAKGAFRPSLSCQSFPQVFSAVKSERFAAVLPEIATRELSSRSFHLMSADALRSLQRDIILIWNPRVIKIRPRAKAALSAIQSILCFS